MMGLYGRPYGYGQSTGERVGEAVATLLDPFLPDLPATSDAPSGEPPPPPPAPRSWVGPVFAVAGMVTIGVVAFAITRKKKKG